MNENNISEAFTRVRKEVEAAKSRGEGKLNFSKLYGSWPDIVLGQDEKASLVQRLNQQGWELENEVVLKFPPN